MKRLEMLALTVISFLALSAEAQNKNFKTDFACDKKASLHLCPKPLAIQVQKAKFGRGKTFICSRKANSTNVCGMKDITNYVKAKCDGRETCQFLADTSVLGEVEGCTYVSKYVEIHYTCQTNDVQDQCMDHLSVPERNEDSHVTANVDLQDDTQFSVKNKNESSANQMGFLSLIISILGTIHCLN